MGGAKKIQVMATVPKIIVECTDELKKFWRMTSRGDTARQLVMYAMSDTRTVEFMGNYFRRPYAHGNVYFPGHERNQSLADLLQKDDSKLEDIKCRFPADEREIIDGFVYALAVKRTKVVSGFLYLAWNDGGNLLRKVAPGFELQSSYVLRRP